MEKCRCKWVHIWSHIQYDSTVFYLWLLLTLNSKYVFLKRKEKNSPPYSTATLSRRKQESKKMMLKDFNNLKDSFRFDFFNICCTSNDEWKVIHTRTAYCIRKLFYAHIFHNQLYHSVVKVIDPLFPRIIFKCFLGITVKTAIVGIWFYFVKDVANR